jgi:hypothetical protein
VHDRFDAPTVRPSRAPSSRLKSRLALGNHGNRPRPVALTEHLTPAGAFVGPTLTPDDADIDPSVFEPEWDERLEDAFFSDDRLDGATIIEVGTFPPVEERVVFAEVEGDLDDDEEEDWIRPRSRWPARLFAAAGAAVVIGLAGFGFGMALEAVNNQESLSIPAIEDVVPEGLRDVLQGVPKRFGTASATTTAGPPVVSRAVRYPLVAAPIAAIGPTEEAAETTTARRFERRARTRRVPPPVAPPKPPVDAAPLPVHTLKPAVSVSALPPAD